MPQEAASSRTGNSLGIALDRVLRLQLGYSSTNTPDMSERGGLIRRSIPGLLEPHIDPSLRVEGSDGIGRKARVPWVRVFDPTMSPKPTQGWYVVFLFNEAGSRVYLSLNQGTQIPTKGGKDFKSRPRDEVAAAAQQARDVLELSTDSALTEPIELGTSRLASDYAAGSVAAFGYERGDIPEDSVLFDDLQTLLSMCSKLDPPQQPAQGSTALAVYVGSAAAENFEFGLKEGVWGWKKEYPDCRAVGPGSLLIFGSNFRGGSPRQDSESFAAHGFDRVVEAIVDGGLSEESEPLWPDEVRQSELIYPFRMRIRRVRERGSMSIGELDAYYGGDVGEALRRSASGGRGVAVELAGARGPTETVEVSLSDVCSQVQLALRKSGLDYGQRHDDLVRSFVVSLATKRLALLTGLSGSGKTRLALAFGQWLGVDRYQVVAVRPDWTGPDALLGYENQLSNRGDDGTYAWVVPETLEFMLRAARDPDYPYLLLLDEMNLAHVERYFADVLSGIESGERILPDLVHENGEWRPSGGPKLPFPQNLFVVGTVNIDETTYMFSPKVLDRANTLEFRVLTEDLQIGGSGPLDIEQGSDDLVAHFLTAAIDTGDESWDGRDKLAEALIELHKILSSVDREFGHRVFQEALRFGQLLTKAGDYDWQSALDFQVMQKVLPRFHGSVKQVANPLRLLASWCFHGPGTEAQAEFDPQKPPDGAPILPISFDKVARMHKRVVVNHFVSFAE